MIILPIINTASLLPQKDVDLYLKVIVLSVIIPFDKTKHVSFLRQKIENNNPKIYFHRITFLLSISLLGIKKQFFPAF